MDKILTRQNSNYDLQNAIRRSRRIELIEERVASYQRNSENNVKKEIFKKSCKTEILVEQETRIAISKFELK
tara:strand:+ start:227 stop:442 length:216 start_codon:yes stop_codon:yes gene_type:complete